MWFKGMLFLVALGLSQLVNAKDVDIEVVTEDAFPLQYQLDGKLYGPTTDIVKLTLAEAELSYQMRVMPWARAYELAKYKPNTLIFSMARTQERENLFYWIGEVTRIEYFLYTTATFAAKNKINAESVKSLKIGAVRNSATYQYLNKNGFEHVFPVASPDQNYEKLLSGRIDMFPASRSTFELSCAKERHDCDQFIPVMSMGLPPTSLYVALSKSTPASTAEKIKQAYKHIVNDIELSLNELEKIKSNDSSI